MWRENLNSFINNQEKAKRITTSRSDPASSSQQEALLHLMKSLDHPTLWYYTRKPAALPYKIQNSILWISRMRDPYIDVCKGGESAFEIWLVSSLWYFLIPLGDWWSLTHPCSNSERQVSQERFLEDSMLLHLADWPYHLSLLVNRTP